MRNLFIYPILLCLLIGCQGGSTAYHPPAIKDLSVEKVKYRDFTVSSFEQASSCEDFELSKADLRELFQKAQYVPMAMVEKQEYSRCKISGSGILEENGDKVLFYIDRARNVSLVYQGETDDPIKRGESYYCAECRSDKFYPLGWKAASNRPVIGNVTFSENGALPKTKRNNDSIVSEEGCKGFFLTESDVLEFFRLARPSDKFEYTRMLNASVCIAAGAAVLQDGREASWLIDQFRRGEMLIHGGSPLYYYGAEVNSPLYSDICNKDCIRGEEVD
jgi:hypothetical protein